MIPRLRRNSLTYDIVVFAKPETSFDPDERGWVSAWVDDGPDRLIPRLGHGYGFIGVRGTAMRATTFEPPSLEHVVGGLWDLAAWARRPWRVGHGIDWKALDRRERQHAHVVRIVDVAIVMLAVVLLRRLF